jgi:hypothetical protein
MVLSKIFTFTGEAIYRCPSGDSAFTGTWTCHSYSGTLTDSRSGAFFAELSGVDNLAGGATALILDTSPPTKPFQLHPRPPPPQLSRPHFEDPPMPAPPRPWITHISKPLPSSMRSTTTLRTTPSRTAAGTATPSPMMAVPATMRFAQTGKTPAPRPSANDDLKLPGGNMEWVAYALSDAKGLTAPLLKVLPYRVLTRGGVPTRGNSYCGPSDLPQLKDAVIAQFWLYEEAMATRPLWQPAARLCK